MLESHSSFVVLPNVNIRKNKRKQEQQKTLIPKQTTNLTNNNQKKKKKKKTNSWKLQVFHKCKTVVTCVTHVKSAL